MGGTVGDGGMRTFGDGNMRPDGGVDIGDVCCLFFNLCIYGQAELVHLPSNLQGG